jgi:hypothetical protein
LGLYPLKCVKRIDSPAGSAIEWETMTFLELMNGAAQQCIDEREAHLIMFTEGLNGYVCPNEGLTTENRAIFKGTYRECQIWVERRGLSAAIRYILEQHQEVPQISEHLFTLDQCLADFTRASAAPSIR